MQTRRRARLRLVLVACSLLVLPTAGGSPADAHSQLHLADPAPGARVGIWPGQVRLEFFKPCRPDARSSVSVVGADGRQLATGAPQVSGTRVSQGVRRATVAGPVVVAYSVVTADGHLQKGGYDFLLLRVPRPVSTSTGPGISPGWWVLALVVGVTACLLVVVAVVRRRSTSR